MALPSTWTTFRWIARSLPRTAAGGVMPSRPIVAVRALLPSVKAATVAITQVVGKNTWEEMMIGYYEGVLIDQDLAGFKLDGVKGVLQLQPIRVGQGSEEAVPRPIQLDHAGTI